MSFAGIGHNGPPKEKKPRVQVYCHCHTCNREIDSLGISRHRAMHRSKKEKCTITYSTGKTLRHDFTDKEPRT